MCECQYWGRNRLDEMFLDVGCVLGYSDCKDEKCEDFRKIKKRKV